MMLHQLFVLSLSFTLAHVVVAQPDPGAGSFVCNPCFRESCFLSNGNAQVNVPGMGRRSCASLQNGADNRQFFPDECADIQSVTLSGSDPCDCRDVGGGDCLPPGLTNTQTCNLCGGNMMIGDPHRIIQSGFLAGTECIAAFDSNSGGAFAHPSICPGAKQLVQQWCRCVSPGTPVKQCIPRETRDRGCNPSDSSDVCCIGQCRYRSQFGKHVCTERPSDPVPPGYSPGPGPSPAPGSGFCFSGDMEVETEDGVVAMKDLSVGDKVLTGDNKFEPVYSFGHRHESIKADYLQLHTTSKMLEISGDHMVFVSTNHAKPASSLTKGDVVLMANGESAVIEKIKNVQRTGVYAPFTLSGSIVVNGFVGSSFVSLQDGEEFLRLGKESTPLSHQRIAHLFETVHRLTYRLGFNISDNHRADGVSEWVHLGHKFGQWLFEQSAVIIASVILLALPFFGTLWCLEQLCFDYLTLTATTVLALYLLSRFVSATVSGPKNRRNVRFEVAH